MIPATVKTVALVSALAVVSGACALRPGRVRDQARAGELEQLAAWLEHERSWVREEAARALASVPGPKAARLLEGLLERSRERWWVRAAAAESLGRIRDPGSLPVLIAVLSTPGQDAEVRLALVDALCAYRDRQALQAIATLEQDDDLLMSATAVRARIECAPDSSP